MERTDIINRLIEFFKYKSYLEIGISHGLNYRKINCETKTGVEPNVINHYPGIIETTSDDFFKNNKRTFDCIFIDGLHYAEQVERDINNSLNVLNENGTIVCHDMNPTNQLMQQVPRRVKFWTGDCWRAWVNLRKNKEDLEMFVVDTDYGVGVIRRGTQKLFTKNVHTYRELEEYRIKVLNLIDIQQFNEKYPPNSSNLS